MELKESLKKRVELFKKENPVADKVKDRITAPSMPFFGEEILEKAVTAILEGENILLCGDKATGKNVLAENLAWIFGRPLYNCPLYTSSKQTRRSS